MKRITDPDFKYVPSYSTDLKKRFRRMAQERRVEELRNALADQHKVAMLPTRAKK